MFSRRVVVASLVLMACGSLVSGAPRDSGPHQYRDPSAQSQAAGAGSGSFRDQSGPGGFTTPPSQGRGGLPSGPTAPSSRRSGQPIMVRVDITVTDHRAAGPAEKKAVWMLVADGERGILRSEERQRASERGATGASLNVEASPILLQDDRIRLAVSVLYDLPDGAEGAAAKPEDQAWTTRLQESFGLVVENKKPIVVSQSADPRGARKVTVEVMATILK